MPVEIGIPIGLAAIVLTEIVRLAYNRFSKKG
jgi:hypothetical protein